MADKTTTTPRSEQKIVARIDRVRLAYKKAERNKSKSAQYKYLRSVLRAYEYFDDNDLLDYLVEIAPCVLMVTVRSGQHSIRTIIDASCKNDDRKLRSRWTRGLQFALARKVPADDLPTFLKANNGISGCADLASKIGLTSAQVVGSRKFSTFARRLPIL